MKDIDKLSINTIRILSAEAVERAKSGHPGMPMAAPLPTLYGLHMKHNPSNPNWVDRDRFILFRTASMLLYSLYIVWIWTYYR